MSDTVRLGSLLAALVGVTTVAVAQDVDWRMYGAASVDAPSFCFFDAKTVTQTNDGLVRVWTKCLSQKELDAVDEKSDRGRKLMEKSGRQLAEGYVPPMVVIGVLQFDQATAAILYEQVADLGDIDPNSRILMELNCSEKMGRRLSTSVKVNGRMGYQDKPSAWEYVSPETNVAYLQKILCLSH